MQPGNEGVRDEPLTVEQYLDSPPPGAVDVTGYVVELNDAWLLCTSNDDQRFGCSGRRLIVTNYDLVDVNAVADASQPQTVTVEPIDDGRVAVAGLPSQAQVTDLDDQIAASFWELFATGEVGPDHPELHFSPDGVELWLGNEVSVNRSLDELADPASWVFDVEFFNAWSGPFSALDVLARAEETTVLAGRHTHCAGLPLDLPDHLTPLHQVSIQPAGIDSCLQWFAIDLFIDSNENVSAISLDLWEP